MNNPVLHSAPAPDPAPVLVHGDAPGAGAPSAHAALAGAPGLAHQRRLVLDRRRLHQLPATSVTCWKDTASSSTPASTSRATPTSCGSSNWPPSGASSACVRSTPPRGSRSPTPVGTLAALWWWLARSPSRHDRGFLAWLALGLLCSSATFAVWTSGGGLETRQFTCFIVVAVVCLAVHRHQRWGLLAASVSLAAAALTRPEGLMLAGCCIGWFAVQRVIVDRQLDWRELTYLIAPFAILTAAHFLFPLWLLW